MIYADYTYYRNSFNGSLIPESEYDYRAARASEYIDRMTFSRITPDTLSADTAVALKIQSCCCAVAEADHSYNSSLGKSAEKVGSYSVTYSEKTPEVHEADRSRLVDMYLGDTGLTFRGV